LHETLFSVYTQTSKVYLQIHLLFRLEGYPLRYVLRVTADNCAGCRSCEMACAFNHYHECNPARARIHILKDDEGLIMPVVCKQCLHPQCAKVCPTGAISRQLENGAVEINESLCIGCGACIEVCPFGSMFVDAKTSKPVKCDLCQGSPKCVEVCPKGAISYIRLDTLPKLRMQEASKKREKHE